MNPDHKPIDSVDLNTTDSNGYLSMDSGVRDEENGIVDIVSAITEEDNGSRSQQQQAFERSIADLPMVADTHPSISKKPPLFNGSFQFSKMREDTLSTEQLPGKARVRRTRKKPGLTGFIHNSISRHFTATQPENDLTYDGGSVSNIRIRREDLNFHELCRMKDEIRPMPRIDRWKLWMRKRIRPNEISAEKSQQIQIPPYREDYRFLKTGFRKLLHLAFHDFTIWLINTTYTNFFLIQFLCYYILIILFTFLLWGTALAYYSNGAKICLSHMEFGNNLTGNLEYAFEASWTSFSTVGFGVVAPTETSGCLGIRFICSMEAAVGILYFGFAGAIFFARVSQALYRAPVTFSSTLCIQYDTGQTTGDTSIPRRTLEMSEVSKMLASPIKYPTLEFRIVHNKANYRGWEILNVSLNCMVAIDVIAPSSVADNSGLSVLFDFEVTGDDAVSRKQTYHKVQLEADSHPYFKRVWHCRHILNDQSPLLSMLVRKEISEFGGWPPNRTSPIGIRSALKKFKTLIITFHGTSNVTSRNVFIEKRYRYEDIFIGWKFAGLIYLEKPTPRGDRYAKVDLSLIHDIQPQNGGGEEFLGSDHISPPVSRHRRVKTNFFES